MCQALVFTLISFLLLPSGSMRFPESDAEKLSTMLAARPQFFDKMLS